MAGLIEALGVTRTLTAIVGAIVFLYGARAYLATRRTSLLVLAAGMGVASGGYLLEGALVELGGWPLESATVLESVFTLVAFALLAASLFVRDRAITTTREPQPAPHPTGR